MVVEKVFKKTAHCVKRIQLRSFFWSVFSRIRTEYGKIRTRKNSVFEHVLHSASKFSVEGVKYPLRLFTIGFIRKTSGEKLS